MPRRSGSGDGGAGSGERTMLVWCPDWPVIAAGLTGALDDRPGAAGDIGIRGAGGARTGGYAEPAGYGGVPVTARIAVVYANRVVACSEAARADGVRRGLRKRDAQSRCPGLIVVDHDPARDARAFEPVVAAVEDLVAGVAVLRPGVCAFPARGPASYFGGEEAAGERIVERIATECGVEAQIGVAEGTFAALLAARAGRHVPPGGTAAFLAGLPVSTLDRPALTGLLERLGVRTLGAFAALRPADVAARFGLDGVLAHRLAGGRDDRPLAIRTPPADLDVEERPEEPIERVDVAAFAARALAERLHARLAGHGLACTRLVIGAVTADGRELYREWRHDGVLTPAGIADRTRWQLDGWLARYRPSGGITLLRLSPQGVLAQIGLQPGLWGEAGEERDRAHRAMHRVQGLLGPDAVLRGVLGGGNDPDGRVTVVPWGEEYLPGRPDGPWPDRLPAPSPAAVPPEPVPVTVLAGDARPVGVSGRLELSAPPAVVIVDGTKYEVAEWAGPWPVDERWWDRRAARARSRFQVRLTDGRMFLLVHAAGPEGPRWELAADYD